jgi:DNA-binding beta-propeller fold protein YncE
VKTLLAALLGLAVLAPAAMAQGDGSLTPAGTAHGRAIGDPRGIAVSPGGGSVYVTSARADAVAVFRRNRLTGALRQLRGRAGCVRNRSRRGCRRARSLADPWTLAVSPDGRNVYVVSLASDAIVAFRRNRRTGALRQVGRRPLPGPSSLALSPNGRFVYAGGGPGVTAFRRNVRTGRLTRIFGPGGGLTQVADVAVDPTGTRLYASSPGAMQVSVFSLAGGVPTPAGCINQSGAGGCTAGRTLNGAAGLALSPDGRQLYAAAEFSGAVAILAHDAATGALSQPAGPLGCIRDGGGLDCAEARFMGHPSLIEVSRDGRNAYVRSDAGLVVLRRDRATGQLSQLPGSKGCIASGNPECTDSAGLFPGAMALSGDGRNAYFTSEPNRPGGTIAIYRRAR